MTASSAPSTSSSGADHILVCNAGSSSLKAELYALDAGQLRALGRTAVEGIGTANAELRRGGTVEPLGRLESGAQAAEVLLEQLDAGRHAPRIVATGHRIVHGGARFTRAVRVDDGVRAALESLGELAPLHNPPALAVLDTVRRRLPGVPAVAAFDTAFFRDLPETARRYAVPDEWHARHGIERFGFHGLAHEWMARRLESQGAPERAVTLQLGHGCSAAALRGGRPVDTSMGFTPLEGLIMATRPGDLDPGVLLALGRQGLDWTALDGALQRESGLKGLSGVTGDVRELLSLEAEGHAGAELALAAFCARIQKYLGAYAVLLGGLDAIAFGGGIGENSAEIRARVCAGLEWLGLELDSARNAGAGGDTCISAAGSAIAVHVVAVREEALIADGVLECLNASSAAVGERV